MHPFATAESKNTTIRPAQNPNDIPVIVDLAEQTWEPTYQSILTSEQLNYMFQEIYNSGALKEQMEAGQQFLLLYQDHTPAGFASYSPLPNKIFKLNKLYVAPAFHGFGYGRLLINAVEEEIKAIGGTTLLLNVNRYNPAKSFYEKCGYTVAYEEDIPIGPYFMNDYVMQKNW